MSLDRAKKGRGSFHVRSSNLFAVVLVMSSNAVAMAQWIVETNPWHQQVAALDRDGALIATLQPPGSVLGCPTDGHRLDWTANGSTQAVDRFDLITGQSSSTSLAGTPFGVSSTDDGGAWLTRRTAPGSAELDRRDRTGALIGVRVLGAWPTVIHPDFSGGDWVVSAFAILGLSLLHDVLWDPFQASGSLDVPSIIYGLDGSGQAFIPVNLESASAQRFSFHIGFLALPSFCSLAGAMPLPALTITSQ